LLNDFGYESRCKIFRGMAALLTTDNDITLPESFLSSLLFPKFANRLIDFGQQDVKCGMIINGLGLVFISRAVEDLLLKNQDSLVVYGSFVAVF